MAGYLPTPISLEDALGGDFAWVDVRSEGEFAHARVPGAINAPVLNNEQRHLVGLRYKQNGSTAAVRLGLQLVGPEFDRYFDRLLELSKNRPVLMHCWRGGLRSHIASTLLAWNNQPVYLLQGGYKAYRTWALERVNHPPEMMVLGGHTGSGKTEILQRLQTEGVPTLDLEGLAHHKGSAFGGLGQKEQPSNEQFENTLALALWWHQRLNAAAPIWVENESRNIGKCALPNGFFKALSEAPVLALGVSRAQRADRLLNEYGHFDKALLSEKTAALQRRLGPQHEKAAQEALAEGRMMDWMLILLDYYDKAYEHGRLGRNIEAIEFDWSQTEASFEALLKKIHETRE
jgi:tRNA 2-selenouridine synthase